MAIWGHETVIVEKDVKGRVWHVRTEANALLTTVPWADAFKTFKYAPDYAEAVATCQSHPLMRLTPEEEALVLYGEPEPEPPLPGNVVPVDFKRRRRK
jgi:hypothetical protein